MKPFIHPHQFNYIKVQVTHLLQTVYFVGDYRVYAAQKQAVRENVLSLFPDLQEPDISVFKHMEDVRGQSELSEFMAALEPYVIPFPSLHADDLHRLFRKVKKLPIPELETVEWSRLSYFGWRDIATKSLFLVTSDGDEFHGIRCSYVAGGANRLSTCSVCGSSLPGNDVGLVVALTKSANYKSVGNHMCLGSEFCNSRITDLTGLHKFMDKALHNR